MPHARKKESTSSQDTTSASLSLTEDKCSRYIALQAEMKRLEGELSQLKKEIHHYFDQTQGEGHRGERQIGSYKITRQIRVSKQYDKAKTVNRLEELQLTDCIDVERKPNAEKIEAAISLGLMSADKIKDCISEKKTKAIQVKQV
ncbi:host-nuclease inhibitor Gam family protein [Caldalkalibacillus salinus]|uniref:host-nuclease inhibitor Gam family protein n=1 Tax=Caldalkalibacillus salinus TaxID=2803787 RepID=UPI001923B634